MRTWVSAPIAKNILEDSIEALEIEKQANGLAKEYRYLLDTKYYTVPDVVGMSIDDAKKMLTEFSIEYSGKGNKIIEMSPEPNSRVPENSTIRLMLG